MTAASVRTQGLAELFRPPGTLALENSVPLVEGCITRFVSERKGARMSTNRRYARVRWRWLCLLAALAPLALSAFAGTAAPAAAQAGGQVYARIAVDRVQALDSIDTFGSADFYARLRIAGHSVQTEPIDNENVITPYWELGEVIAFSAGGFSAEVEIWDEDSGFDGRDNQIDIIDLDGRTLGLGVAFDEKRCGFSGRYSERLGLKTSELMGVAGWSEGVCRLSQVGRGAESERALVLVSITIARLSSAEPLVPLYGWWDGARGDNFATSDPRWAGAPGDRRAPDYDFARLEGHVFNPALPQPAGTVPLYSWYSGEREDNFITSDPAWAGAPGDTREPGYGFSRMEGYIYREPGPARAPLYSWWSGERGDNFATTDPAWAGAPGDTREPVYAFARVEGYLPATAATFGFGTARTNGRMALGERPLLTVLIDYADTRFAAHRTPAFYRDLLFATAEGKLVGSVAGRGGFFDENSFGQFWFANAGVIGPVTHPDDPATPRDESTYTCAWSNEGGCNGGHHKVLANAVRGADRTGFGFARYDLNGDRQVTSDELTILVIEATPGNDQRGASNRSTSPPCIPVSGGVEVCTPAGMPGAGEAVGAATLAHELAHAIGVGWETYGSNCKNSLYSLMTCTIFPPLDDRAIFHLDPFAKLKLGWLRPTVLSIDESRCLDLHAMSDVDSDPAKRAYLIYDPARGPGEYFLLEYRRPMGLNYDGDPWAKLGRLSVPDTGLGVWYVKTDADTNLPVVPALEGGSGNDVPLYILPARGTPGRAAVGRGLWTVADGELRPRWPLERAPSGLALRVERVADGGRALNIRMGAAPCPFSLPTIVIPRGGGILDVRDVGVGRFTFAPGSFDREALLSVAPLSQGDVPPLGRLVSAGRFYSVDAIATEDGEPLAPGTPYTVEVPYPAEVTAGQQQRLGLYFWDEDVQRWVREPSTEVDPARRVVRAVPTHFSRWALLVEPAYGIYLPLITRN